MPADVTPTVSRLARDPEAGTVTIRGAPEVDRVAVVCLDQRMTGADSTFHVDLRGVVDLLSHHLYSSPRVYLRELLQNAVDAITARVQEEPHAPRRVRVVPADVSPDGCLHVEDTGIGLDEAGIREVLATIGASTKRDALGLARESFLGQFGIGLLSCFLVTDEIRVTTRRAGSDETWMWVGRDDGTYAVSPAAEPRTEAGTDVAIRPRGSAANLLSAGVVERLAASFAAYLQLDLAVETTGGPVSVAGRSFPWEGGEAAARRAAAGRWCEGVLGFTPLDVVDLSDPAAGVRGQAFVLPHSSAARGTHRLYAKRMLVGEAVPDVLPEWAFFVRGVLDTDGLGLTASRSRCTTTRPCTRRAPASASSSSAGCCGWHAPIAHVPRTSSGCTTSPQRRRPPPTTTCSTSWPSCCPGRPRSAR